MHCRHAVTSAQLGTLIATEGLQLQCTDQGLARIAWRLSDDKVFYASQLPKDLTPLPVIQHGSQSAPAVTVQAAHYEGAYHHRNSSLIHDIEL